MKVALVLHGDPPTPRELALLDECDATVCADGGARALLRDGRVPTWVVGDMDSLSPDDLLLAESRGARVRRFPAEKNETDGEHALDVVLESKPTSVLLLGAHGGRTAMFLANLKLLRACHDKGLRAQMVGHGETLEFISAGGRLFFAKEAGAMLDVLPVDGPAVVSLRGTAFDVQQVVLGRLSARGVSNRLMTSEAAVEVHQGTVLTILGRAELTENR